MLWLAALTACGGGGGPVGPQARFDVFHDVYLRGGPSDGDRGRVALTFDGITPCTGDLLGRLKAPVEGGEPLRATFFLDRASLEEAASRDGPALRGLLERLVAEGHAVALGLAALPPRWRVDAAAFRVGLAEEARAVADLLRAHGVEQPELLRLWRPPLSAALDLHALGRAADVERPLVLWSLQVPPDEPAVMVERVASRLADGDIVALPGGGAGCPALAALPALAEALGAARLRSVTVHELLGRSLARHLPLRVVRYRGRGLPESCAGPLDLPEIGDDAEAVADRWGLVRDDEPGLAALQVLPLPGAAGGTAQLLDGPLDLARRLWRARDRWRGLPGCQRTVSPYRLSSPLAPSTTGEPMQWWVAGPDGVEPRDARALAPPGDTVVLPARADLVRLEARQRLPWRLRGLVGEALTYLGLEAPLLVEARTTVGLLVGAPLAPAAAAEPASLRAAVAGYVQLVEVSLGEYLFLATRAPGEAAVLARAARAADGFVRAGPFLTVPAEPGGAPQPDRLGIGGRAALEEPPAALLARVLRAGVTLRPGDVVAAAPPPVRGGPHAEPDPELVSHRAVQRSALVRSIVRGLGEAVYLRPGSVIDVDGDLLGRQVLRVAVPPGVAVPSVDVGPLVDQVEPTETDAR